MTRYFFVRFVVVLAMANAAVVLIPKEAEASVCCNIGAQCGMSGYLCCDAETAGAYPCSPTASGYCLPDCDKGGVEG